MVFTVDDFLLVSVLVLAGFFAKFSIPFVHIGGKNNKTENDYQAWQREQYYALGMLAHPGINYGLRFVSTGLSIYPFWLYVRTDSATTAWDWAVVMVWAYLLLPSFRHALLTGWHEEFGAQMLAQLCTLLQLGAGITFVVLAEYNKDNEGAKALKSSEHNYIKYMFGIGGLLHPTVELIWFSWMMMGGCSCGGDNESGGGRRRSKSTGRRGKRPEEQRLTTNA